MYFKWPFSQHAELIVQRDMGWSSDGRGREQLCTSTCSSIKLFSTTSITWSTQITLDNKLGMLRKTVTFSTLVSLGTVIWFDLLIMGSIWKRSLKIPHLYQCISGDCFSQHAELIVQRDMGWSSDGRGREQLDGWACGSTKQGRPGSQWPSALRLRR